MTSKTPPSPPAGAPPPSGLQETVRLTRQVALLSVSVALGLTAIKLFGWWRSGSVGVLASLADSGLDVLASLGTLGAIRVAATPPDAEHRFGHGKAEAFASLWQAVLIFISAALIARQAVVRLIAPEAVKAEGGAMLVMAISTVLAVGVSWAQTRVLRQARSTAVEGDRLHYIADVASNLVTLAGLAAARLLHAPRADAAAGLLVSVGLAWGGAAMIRGASHSLMDHELDEAERREIIGLVLSDPQIEGVHQLRTRTAGPVVHLQMHVDMDPRRTLEDAHHILIEAERRILTRFPAADILIHPDPHGRAEAHGGVFPEREFRGGDRNPEPAA